MQACRGTESPCGRPHGEGTGSDQGMSEWRGCVRRRGSRRGEGSDRQACSPAWALYSMSTAPTAGSIHVELKWARPSGGVQVKYGATSTLGFSKHLLLLHPCAPQVSYLSRTVTSWRCASLSSPHPGYPSSQSSPVHCDGAEFRDGVECAARFVAV